MATGSSRTTAPNPATLAKGKGPGPMELDGQNRLANITCNQCGGKGHLAKDCPLKPLSGYEAKIEEVREPDSDDSDEEIVPLKGSA